MCAPRKFKGCAHGSVPAMTTGSAVHLHTQCVSCRRAGRKRKAEGEGENEGARPSAPLQPAPTTLRPEKATANSEAPEEEGAWQPAPARPWVEAPDTWAAQVSGPPKVSQTQGLAQPPEQN